MIMLGWGLVLQRAYRGYDADAAGSGNHRATESVVEVIFLPLYDPA
jgi:hypothetical protein